MKLILGDSLSFLGQNFVSYYASWSAQPFSVLIDPSFFEHLLAW
jgi:hypothetical protein